MEPIVKGFTNMLKPDTMDNLSKTPISFTPSSFESGETSPSSILPIETISENEQIQAVQIMTLRMKFQKIFESKWNFITKLYYLTLSFIRYRIFFYGKNEFIEVIEEKEGFIFVFVFSSTFIIIGIIFTTVRNIDDWFILIVNVSFGLSFIIVFIVFLIFKSIPWMYRLCVALISTLINLSLIITLMESQRRGYMANGSVYFGFLLVPFLNLYVNAIWWSIFWIIIYILISLLGFTIEMIFNFEITAEIIEPSRVRLNGMQFYAQLLLCTLFGMIGYLRQICIARKERQIVMKVSKSIRELKFETKFIKGFLAKKRDSSVVSRYFKLIVKQMKNYSSFLPDFEEMTSVDENMNNSSDNSSSSGGDLGSNKSKSSMKSSISSNGSNEEIVDVERAKGLFNRTRMVVIMQIVVHIMEHSFLSFENGRENVQQLFQKLILNISKFSKSGAKITNIWDNRITVTWNASSVSTNSLEKSCSSALIIMKEWALSKYSKTCHLGILIMNNVESFCGNFGTSRWKRFSIYSRVNMYDRLSDLNRLLVKHKMGIVVEGLELLEKLKYNFVVKQVDYNFKSKLEIFEVLGIKGKSDKEEWLYEISDELVDSGPQIENAWELFKENKIEKASNIIKGLDGDKYCGFLKQKINEMNFLEQ